MSDTGASNADSRRRRANCLARALKMNLTSLNDGSFGRGGGDSLLIELIERLRYCVRRTLPVGVRVYHRN